MAERARRVEYFDEAVAGDAPRYKAAQLMALSERTIKRWPEGDSVAADRRPHTQAAHQLTPEEEQAMLDVCNIAQYQSLPPSQIVPPLADKGIYIASSPTGAGASRRARCWNRPALRRPAPTRSTIGTSALARPL